MGKRKQHYLKTPERFSQGNSFNCLLGKNSSRRKNVQHLSPLVSVTNIPRCKEEWHSGLIDQLGLDLDKKHATYQLDTEQKHWSHQLDTGQTHGTHQLDIK